MILVLGVISLLVVLFVLWRARFRYPPNGMPQTLCYHKLSDKFCFEGTWTTPRNFLAQIEHLKSKGFRFIDEDEYLESIENPSPENGRKLLLTFDDGYGELYDLYLNELKPRGVPVLIFLVSDYVGSENKWDLSLGRRPHQHLSWREIRELSAAGARFGSHGARHLDLTRLSFNDRVREVVNSKRRIEEETGTRVWSMSYPYGRYDEQLQALVRDAGYHAAFSLYPHHPNERVDRFALRRNGVYVIDTNFSIECKLKPNPLFWFEEMKCRAINAVAVLTPILKRFSAPQGR